MAAAAARRDTGDRLGGGTFGTVRVGEERGEEVAVKHYRFTSQSGVCTSLVREAAILSSLPPHDCVVRGRADWQADPPRMIFPLARGDLVPFTTGKRKRPEDVEIEGWCNEIGSALAHIHSHGVLHRDVKPGNVLLYGDGRVRLADFGSACLVLADLPKREHGVTTYTYASPEMLRCLPYSHPLDYWSLGVAMAEVWMTEALFRPEEESDLPHVVAASVLAKHGADLERVKASIPARWRRLLSIAPENRCEREEEAEWRFEVLPSPPRCDVVGPPRAPEEWIDSIGGRFPLSDPTLRLARCLALRASQAIDPPFSLTPRDTAVGALSCASKLLETADVDFGRHRPERTMLVAEVGVLSAVGTPASHMGKRKRGGE